MQEEALGYGGHLLQSRRAAKEWELQARTVGDSRESNTGTDQHSWKDYQCFCTAVHGTLEKTLPVVRLHPSED